MNKEKLLTGDSFLLMAGGFLALCIQRMITFAIGFFLILESQSTSLYSAYMLTGTLPALVVPVIAGPFLDRWSKRNVLCFLNALFLCIYLFLLVVWRQPGGPGFIFLLAVCAILGILKSLYELVHETFFAVLLEKESYQKGYAVFNTLEMITYCMMPLAVILYSRTGMAAILFLGSAVLVIALVMECLIKDKGVGRKDADGFVQDYAVKMKDGVKCLSADKGLLCIQLFLAVDCLAMGAKQVVELPYFMNHFADGGWLYIQIWLASMIGRMAGNGVQYGRKLAPEKRFSTAFSIYLCVYLLGGVYLFMSENIMWIMCFLSGFLSTRSYNIRISAVQSYVEDEKKGRLQSISQFFESGGLVLGQALAGILAIRISERAALAVFMGAALVFVVVVMGRSAEVKKIYNGES